MGQFNDISIQSVVNELNQSYYLPDIQREYVWLRKPKEKKIEQLFDSILRGYPIGSFLFWKLKRSIIETKKDTIDNPDKLNFQLYKFIENFDERNPYNMKVNIEQVNSDDLIVVLDGQQRLSSLYIGLKGSRTLKRPNARRGNPNAFEEKKLYLNLKYQPKADNPNDNYDFRFLKPNELPKNDSKNFWYKVGDILYFKSEQIFSFKEQNELSDSEAGILLVLKDVFCTQPLISYFEETEKNLDKVLKIFIRVNSGGTKLSYSDLLMSILTANFSSDIRGLMKIFVSTVNEEGFGIMGRDQILKTCLILTESNHIFNLKNFSKHNIHKIEKNWEKITKNVYSAIDLLIGFGYRNNISSAYIILTVAYFYFRNEKVTDDDKNEILKFVRKAQIKSYFTTSLDNKLETVAKVVRSTNSFELINKELANNKKYPLNITADDVERMIDIQYGSPAVLPVLQLLYPNLDYKNSTFHIDHIYPKSKFNKKNDRLQESHIKKANYLYNLQLLQGPENNAKRAKDPDKWIFEEFSSTEEIRAYKDRNYINESCELTWENISDFELKRNELILNKLRKTFDIP